MGFEKYYEARRTIVDFLEKDLFGPVEEDEVLDEYPLGYYSLGILYPQNSSVDDTEDMATATPHADDEYDEEISMSNLYYPSTMAISTTVSAETEHINIKVEAAQYLQLAGEKLKEHREAIGESGDKNRKIYWGRRKLEYNNITVKVGNKKDLIPEPLTDGLELQLYVQKVYGNGDRMITVALVNKNKYNNSYLVNNENSFFQCKLTLSGDNNSPVFIENRKRVPLTEDKEMKNLNMLYSHVKNYAMGHGCSVDWETACDDGAYMIMSSFIPLYEIKQMKPSLRTANRKIFNVKYLAEASRNALCTSLKGLTESYGDWIENQKTLSQQHVTDARKSAAENLSKCSETRERIEEALDLMSRDDKVFRAFQLANMAMLNQRIQFMIRKGKSVEDDKIDWYPFQLAFILQEIPSVADPDNSYRETVDLLWFPTGGGKTEAYLGLAAFTIFLRKLRKPENSGGVTILMRYTLRLLTMQQFERAASLLMACEKIRRTLAQELGNEEISLGLWVGRDLTPNNIAKAEEALKELNSGENLNKGNPVQVLNCPWCGKEIGPEAYSIKNGRMNICCPDEHCEFHKRLPMYLVDEDIYNRKPTMVISTVDKLARLTWEPEAGKLFGIGTKNDPPELIIQDELHLISGPLGTIAGLYEVAVNRFCQNNGISAKVVASTATIRNAGYQILNLFGKPFRQFPPQGVSIKDSYFAEEAEQEDKPTREYVGILTSKTSATTLVRVNACMLFATRYLVDLGYDDEVIDSFWTITGYFNSLRELGGAIVQMHDDVQDRLKYLYTKKFKGIAGDFTGRKVYSFFEELTSRVPSSKIAEALTMLNNKYPSASAYDFILASNMISVGVDVGRLGLMIVAGQPKTNAEYIQATSRVGRATPGLVITVYNPARSRDRSHFEQFRYYHSALYKYVEATSITPFSPRARDKVLASVYVTLCRHLIWELRNNKDAAKYSITLKELKNIRNYLSDYVSGVDPGESKGTMADLDSIIREWSNSVKFELIYNKYGAGTGLNLLKTESDENGVFTAINSMRNVDKESNIYLEDK